MKKLATLVVLMLQVSCAHYGGYGDLGRGEFKTAMDTWLGATEFQVVEHWGIPTREYGVPGGQKLLEYKLNGGTTVNTFNTKIGNNIYSDSYVTHRGCKITFILNFEPLSVVQWRAKGNNCY